MYNSGEQKVESQQQWKNRLISEDIKQNGKKKKKIPWLINYANQWFLIPSSLHSKLISTQWAHYYPTSGRRDVSFLVCRLEGRPAAAHSSWFKQQLVTLAAFHGHIDFSPTLQIIAGCCESYPPLAGREEPLQCVDMRPTIWFEESDILASHWLRLTSLYFLSMPWAYI